MSRKKAVVEREKWFLNMFRQDAEKPLQEHCSLCSEFAFNYKSRLHGVDPELFPRLVTQSLS
jgi:hypothetical protein